MDQDFELLGRLAYETYNCARGGKAYDGSPISTWENVKPEIRDAWCLAAKAVREKVAPHVG
jgi:hypothetical protein